MKRFKKVIYLFVSLFGSALLQAAPCDSLLGTFKVVPYTEPKGLSSISKEFLSDAPIGTPMMKVSQTEHGFLYQGLTTGYQAEIDMLTGEMLRKSGWRGPYWQGIFGESAKIKCTFDLGQDSYFVEVDLSKVPNKELEETFEYTKKMWRISGENKDPTIKYPKQKKVLSLAAFKSTKYFYTKTISDGIVTVAIFVPLEKVKAK